MSTATAMVIFTVFVFYLGFQAVKNFQIRNLNLSLKNKDYRTVERLADMATSRRLLGEYACDLYKLRARYMEKNPQHFQEMLTHMIATDYKNMSEKRNFLEQYFHLFLIKGNELYSKQLLDGIRAMQDPLFTKYNEQAFAVMIEKRTDLIEQMIDEINQKHYYGFALGVILFVIAQQYEQIGETQNAIIYYQNAKVCFRPDAIYIPVLQERLKKLEEIGKNISA